MTPERWQQVREVLEKALELTPSQRSAFLDGACLSDASLRQEVETLLAASDDVRSSFLQSSAPRVTITPGTKLGEYEVKSLLGSGGMGEVYRARDSRLGRDVAIKVLPSFLSADSDRLRRFEQEARAAAALNHPNILAVFQMGTYEEAPYLVSELLEGDTLREQINRGRLPIRKSIDYGVQIARGLAAAHEKGIVHRDLKPENLFCTKDGRVKILDFGLAKLTQPQSGSDKSALTLTQGTEAGMVMGTVGYMAPEQVRGQTADHRADIFAFGAILYEMLAGKRAFQKPTSAETMTAILNEDPPGISQVATNLPPALQRVVHRCLEKNPEQRFQSASDLAFALDALSENAGSGTGYSAKEKVENGLFPFIREHKRLLVKLFSGFLVGLALLVIGGGWLWLKGRQSSPLKVLTERQITHNLSDNSVLDGEISPDGKYVAFVDHKGLHLMTLQSGESHDIALPHELQSRLSEVNWFPDGENLIIESDSESEGGILSLISVFGGTPHKFRTHSFGAKVSPDGSSIAFLSGRGHEIWVAGADGGNAKTILSNENAEYRSVIWSPTGKRLAYLRSLEKVGLNPNEGGSIETISLNGGSPNVVVSDPKLLLWGDLVWLPDGRLIFSSSELTQPVGDGNLWTITTDVRTGLPLGNPVKVTNWTATNAFRPNINSEGSRLVVLKHHERSDAFVSELKENGTRIESAKSLTSSDSHNIAAAWTPDSRALLLMSDRVGGRFQIYKQNLGMDGAEALIKGPDDQMWPTFSSDSTWILYWSVPKGTNSPATAQRLMRLSASGGSPEQVLEAPVDPMISFSCPSRPSSSCVISRGDQGQLIFYALDPVQGQGKEVIRTTLGQANDLQWSISPDSSHIAIGSGTQLRDEVRILDLQKGKEQNLPLPKEWSITALSWAADGKAVFAGVSANHTLIARIDLEGKRQILLERENGFVGGPFPSPDGRHLAYFQNVYDTNVWLLENF